MVNARSPPDVSIVTTSLNSFCGVCVPPADTAIGSGSLVSCHSVGLDSGIFPRLAPTLDLNIIPVRFTYESATYVSKVSHIAVP